MISPNTDGALFVATAPKAFGDEEPTMSAEREKQAAAEAAAELVENGMTVGLGTGSTVAFLLPALARRKIDIRCVATSPRTEDAARQLGIASRSMAPIKSPLTVGSSRGAVRRIPARNSWRPRPTDSLSSQIRQKPSMCCALLFLSSCCPSDCSRRCDASARSRSAMFQSARTEA